MMGLTTLPKPFIKDAAARLGFDFCGIAPAQVDDQNRERYREWIERGYHGEMAYLKRVERNDLRMLLPKVRSVICVAMVYNAPLPYSTHSSTNDGDTSRAWISRYSWGDDYHAVLQEKLEKLLAELRAESRELFDAKIYVDTGPLLERALAWAAGIGWMAKNTCLIHERMGSWFVIGEILTQLELEPDAPAFDRCGTCTRCIDACPTHAITGRTCWTRRAASPTTPSN